MREATMNTALRVVLAVVAAAGTLAAGRAVAAQEQKRPMSLRLSVGVGVVLLAVYIGIAFSI